MKNKADKALLEVWDMKDKARKAYLESGFTNYIDYINNSTKEIVKKFNIKIRNKTNLFRENTISN